MGWGKKILLFSLVDIPENELIWFSCHHLITTSDMKHEGGAGKHDEKELQLDQLNCNAKQHFHRNLAC